VAPADSDSVGASYSNGPRYPSVRLSVCLSVSHARISPQLSEIDVWLLLNSSRNLCFPIQNLPSDSRSEVRFRHFGCFRVALSDKLYRKDGTTLGTVAGQLSSRPITDDTSSFTEAFPSSGRQVARGLYRCGRGHGCFE